MIESEYFGHTLAGFIYEATPGSHMVITSEDLSPFLCSLTESTPPVRIANQLKASTDGVTHNITPSLETTQKRTKSCKVAFALGLKNNNLEIPSDWNSTRTLIHVSGCKLTLEKPYLGPHIINGCPRVFLRTNLAPSSSRSYHRSHPSKSIADNVIRSYPHLENKIALPAPVNVIRSHPDLPYLFVGNVEDVIYVVSPESFTKQ
jgi:hypothetical protein